MKFLKTKEELKTLAARIKETRPKFKEGQRTNDSGAWRMNMQLLKDAYDFRHKHIAYCMLRGRKYEEIERTTREDNKANMKLVTKLMEEIKNENENENENVHPSESGPKQECTASPSMPCSSTIRPVEFLRRGAVGRDDGSSQS